MTSEGNAGVVRRVYEAWNGPDPVDGVLPMLDPAFEWVNPPHAVEPGTRRGRQPAGGWLRFHSTQPSPARPSAARTLHIARGK